jgi:Autophagy protein ATG9
MLSHGARFVAFIAGSFAALLLGAALVDDQLLERRLGGRTLVWCAAMMWCHASRLHPGIYLQGAATQLLICHAFWCNAHGR